MRQFRPLCERVLELKIQAPLSQTEREDSYKTFLDSLPGLGDVVRAGSGEDDLEQL